MLRITQWLRLFFFLTIFQIQRNENTNGIIYEQSKQCCRIVIEAFIIRARKKSFDSRFQWILMERSEHIRDPNTKLCTFYFLFSLYTETPVLA